MNPGISRRRFLGMGLAGAAALAAPGRLRGEEGGAAGERRMRLRELG
ncbi:hypothetical protein HYY27_00435, partial [bacterium]|nr:hypothetical protein [bacterium]